MHMDIMTIQPNQGSRSKETQNREISPENADRMQNADFRERHRGNSSPSRSASGTGSIQTIWVRLHRSFAPRQRVVARIRAEMPPSLGREKIFRNLLHGLNGRAEPRINHTHAIHTARHWPQKLYKPPSKRDLRACATEAAAAAGELYQKNKKHIICKNRLVALT